MNHFILTPLSTVQKLMAANFTGTFLFSREAAKIMMKNKWGRIINFSTVAVPLHLEGEAVYASMKSAIETSTKVMARELAKFNITCNVIGPAPVETDLIKNVPKEKIDKIVNLLSLNRLCTWEDIVHVADFFISESSSYVTGQVVYLGGV